MAFSQLIYFRGKRTPIPNVKIKLNGIQLFATDHIKYVGITFDEHLTFQRHIKLLNAKLKRTNSLLAILKLYVTRELLLIMDNFTLI